MNIKSRQHEVILRKNYKAGAKIFYGGICFLLG